MMDKTPTLNDKRKSSAGYQIVIYSLIFFAMMIFIYKDFILASKGFNQIHDDQDSLAQRYMFLSEFKRFLGGLFAGGQINTWDWSLGLGGDAYQFNISSLVNPFSYIALLFPVRLLDLGYFIGVMLRLYAAGLTFIAFARKIDLGDLQTITGSVIYALCPWSVIVAITQGQFIIGAIMFPLICLGTEKILRAESPALFIITVAYTVIANFQFAFMIGLMIVVYYIVRYLTTYNEGGLAGFFKKLGMYIVYGLIGIMTSAAGLIMILTRYGGATISSTREIGTLLPMEDYIRFPCRLSSWGTVFGNYSIIGVSAICIVMVPIIVWCFFRGRTPAIMTTICLAFAALPFFSSVLNFMSYPTGRWMFMLSFFFVWAAVDGMDERFLRPWPAKVSIAVVSVMYLLYVYWYKHNVDSLAGTTKVNCVLMLVIVVLLIIRFSNFTIQRETWARVMSACLVIVITGGMTYAFMQKIPDYANGKLQFGEAYDMLQKSPQKAAQGIEDDSFWREDQVDGIDKSRYIRCKINENAYFGNRSVYQFASSIDAGWLEYNKLLGNNQGYYKRVAICGDDNRMGLEFLHGVKYFLGNSENGSPGASDYAGYGFKDKEKIDGTDVLENEHFIGLGAVYTDYMTKSDWLDLSYPQRELAMVRAAVMPDDFKAPEGMKPLSTDVLDMGVEELGYTLTGIRNAVIHGEENLIHVDPSVAQGAQEEIYASGRKTTVYGTMEIQAEGTAGGQLIIDFKNVKNSLGSYTLRFTEGDVQKTIVFDDDSSQGLADVEDVTVNMGYSDEDSRTITMDFLSRGGDFTYDSLNIYSEPAKTFEKYASALEKSRLEVTEMKGDTIEGTVTSKKGGILYLSILDNNGWDVYIDGVKTPKIDETDIAFTGVLVDPGEHQVKLVYHTPRALLGLLVTLAGLIITVLIEIFRRRKRRSQNGFH